MISIIIPTLNEERSLPSLLNAICQQGADYEVIVVDGGSADGSAELARPLCDRVVIAPRGRAAQMNAGAQEARGDVLLFLHADTRCLPGAPEAISQAMKTNMWGRFDVEIEGTHPLLKVVAWSMNLRSRLTGIATGDQAIFVRRDAFAGFPEIPLMEDVAFSRAMKRRGAAPACLRSRVRTSGRRWESRGVLRTVLLMWRLRLAYALGADPARLAEKYR